MTGQAGGFRYGNVSFQFPWAEIISGRDYFWVESIAYGIEACRILVSSTDWSRSLQPYDPTLGNGPWWVDPAGNHYWNGSHRLEVMFEDDLDLRLSTGLTFVDHHRRFCNTDPSSCRFRGTDKRRAGAEFLGTLASRIHEANLPTVLRADSEGRQWIDPGVSAALDQILHTVSRTAVLGPGIQASDPIAAVLGRALLAALYGNRPDEFALVAGLFNSSDPLVETVTNVLATEIGDDAATIWRATLDSDWP
jgi:hypothetical protein